MGIKANLVIDQGATFSTSITLTDEDGNAMDLTGYSAAAQMRRHYTSSTKYDFNVNLAESRIELRMTANSTTSIAAGRYVYDVEMTDPTGNIERVLEGIVTVTPNVTR